MDKKCGFFNYFCVDKDWKKTFLIGTLIYCFNEILVGNVEIKAVKYLVSFIVLIFFFGWQSCTINKRTLKPDKGFFGFEEIGTICLVGLKTFVGFFVYGLVSCALIKGVFLLFPKATIAQIGSNSFSVLALVILPLVLLLLAIIIMYGSYSAYLAFCFDLKPSSFFNYKKIRVLIKKGLPDITLAILKIYALIALGVFLIFVISIVYGMINASVFINVLGFAPTTREVALLFCKKTSFIYCAPISFYMVALGAEIGAGCLRKIIAKNTTSEDKN